MTAAGFFQSDVVRTALVVGAGVAIVTGVAGVFTVIRGQAFAGHSLGEVGASGGSAAFLGGINPLWGFLAITIAAAGAIEALGLHRPRARDLAAGLVLGAGLGLAALFLYLDTTTSSTTGATVAILFGSLFAVSDALLPLVVLLSLISLGLLVACYRSLLLSSLSPELAAARGVRVRLVSMVYLLALAIAVSLAAQTIGAVLATALLIGPAATALRLTDRPGASVVLAAGIGIGAVWLGIFLAYESYYWPPAGHGWPVSFFVVSLVFVAYLLGDAAATLRSGLRRHTELGLFASGRERPAVRDELPTT